MTSRVGLVFGGTAGIGAAIVAHRSELGERVFAASRRGGEDSKVLRCDLRDPLQVDEAVQRVNADGDLGFVVNCVGIGRYAPIGQTGSAAWREILDTNVLGLLHLISSIEQFAPELSDFVHLSSLAAHQPSTTPGNECYAASKVAARALMERFTAKVRAESRSLRVSMVSPGYVHGTEFADDFFPVSSPIHFDLFEGHSALTPDAVASVVDRLLDNRDTSVVDVILTPPGP